MTGTKLTYSAPRGKTLFRLAAVSALALGAHAALAEEAPVIPTLPAIIVPDFVGVEPAQQSFEDALGDELAKIDGIRISPARCGADGAFAPSLGMVVQDESGVTANLKEGQFVIDKSGAGTANIGGAQFTVNKDGSGTINRDGEDGGEQITVETDGSGTYNGPGQQITLDGKGGGTWNSDAVGQLTIDTDGGGTWNGPLGQINNDGKGGGTWNGEHRIVNSGDGTGIIDGKRTTMEPLPPVPPAGKFPLLTKFRIPPQACGYVITLADSILFDFDKSELRSDAASTVDMLAAAFVKVGPKRLEVRGHTDGKGSAEYNQDLSERRAATVENALKERDVSSAMTSRGLGKTQPVAANEINGKDNPQGRQLNRRVEIYVPNS